jgi:DNA-binding GntR family transcriptional regulator
VYGEPVVRPGSASDRVYAVLRDEIVSWRIPAGTPLSEVELAERLGVSRTPLRAALTRLALEGLVDTSQGRTGVVAEMSSATVADLFELREALEVHAARLAAKRCDPRVFEALAAEFDAAAAVLQDGGAGAYYGVIGRFDDAVDRAIRNPALRASLAATRTHLARARRLAADNPQRLLQAASEHAAICRAVAAGDETLAAAATTVHLRTSLATILATLSSRSEERRSS